MANSSDTTFKEFYIQIIFWKQTVLWRPSSWAHFKIYINYKFYLGDQECFH